MKREKITENLLKLLKNKVTFGMLILALCQVPIITQSQNPESFDSSKFPDLSAEQMELFEKALEFNRNPNNFPPIWDPPLNTGLVQGILVWPVSNPRINEIPLDPFDYIGGFYLDDNDEYRCGGAYYWDPQYGIIVTLYGDDPQSPEKDGFSFGETVQYRFYSQTTQKDYIVDEIEYKDTLSYITNGKWYKSSLAIVLDMQALEVIDFYIDPSANPICMGDQLELSGQEFIGSGGPYTFDWTSDPPGFNHNTQFPPPVNPDVTTTYSLVVQDGDLISEHEITVVVNEDPQANAGEDAEVCGNEIFQLSGTAENFTTVEWTTSGDGTFGDQASLETTYTPGPMDNENGDVMLTLNVNPLNPCLSNATDHLILTVLPLPTVDPGGDMSACGNDPVLLDANAQNFSTIEWATDGDGYFSDPASSETQYFPQGDDIIEGVTLTVCAEAVNPCSETACASFDIAYLPGPSVNAPSSRTRCEDQVVSIPGNASNNSGILWTTQGDGTFEDNTALPALYHPGPDDRENGGTTVTVSALPNPPCTLPATKDVTINLQKLPDIVTFGPDTDFACSDSYLQLNAQVENYSGISWSTSGDGTFNSTTSLSARYYPGPGDMSAGNFELTLSANAQVPCVGTVEQTKFVEIIDNPVAIINIENGQHICEEEPFPLDDVTTSSYDVIEWTTSGDGTFTNPAIPTPQYYPGEGDVASVTSIMLTITAEPIAPCEVAATDHLNVYFEPMPVADAGDDDVICEDTDYQLNGIADHYESIHWETSGDGTFDDDSNLTALYTPGLQDIENGLVALKLVAQPISPCTYIVEDEMLLEIQWLPEANAGINQTICESATVSLSEAEAENYSSVFWETDGDGSFSNPNELNPDYTPGNADIANGGVNLTLTAEAVSPCVTQDSESLSVVIIWEPVANAGENAEICENDDHQLNGTAENYQTIMWETDGDGTFDNASNINATYTPGPQDIDNGSVALALVAEPIFPCTLIADDQMILDIQRLPEAIAGNDATICETDNIQLIEAEAENYSSLLWETSGDGTFDNSTVLNPVYSPGDMDIENGSVNLTLTASAILPCLTSNSESMTITIIPLPSASAGDDAEICEDESYQLNGFAEHYQSVLWETNGDGSFDDASSLTATYTPGVQDIENGNVALTLIAEPLTPCAIGTEDQMEIQIQKLPFVSAGANETICENETFMLSEAQASNYSFLSWQTNGDGTFSDHTVLQPEYIPGADDIANGIVTLTLSAQAVNPCQIASSDQISLSIVQLPTADAGADITACGETSLNGNVENASELLWETNGDGVFNNLAIENPIYTPGEQDIQNQAVVLTITAEPLSPCSLNETDAMIYHIDFPVEINDEVNDQEIQMGNPLQLVYEASSVTPGTYQWYKDGVLIDGQNSSVLDIAEIQPEDAGYYQAFYSNACGELESNVALIEVFQPSTHHIALPQQWSGISSYITPDNPAMENVFADITSSLILISNYQGVYWPEQGVNTLGNWSVTSGYKIKMAENNSLFLQGEVRYPLAELSIPAGWSYLPVNTPCAVNVADFFGDYPGIAMIKEIAGTGIYWPELGINTIQELNPGEAYEILNNGSEIAFKYPFCDDPIVETKSSETQKVSHPWNNIHRTPATHVFGLTSRAVAKLEQGDIVGIFTAGDICVGVVDIRNDETAAITAFADDQLTSSKDGFTQGEKAVFKVYRSSTGEEFALDIQYSDYATSDGLFVPGGISHITDLEYKASSTNDDFSKVDVRIYPNPTNGKLNILFGGYSINDASVQISNAQGQVVIEKELNSDNELNLSTYPKGIYYLNISADDFMRIEKIILK